MTEKIYTFPDGFQYDIANTAGDLNRRDLLGKISSVLYIASGVDAGYTISKGIEGLTNPLLVVSCVSGFIVAAGLANIARRFSNRQRRKEVLTLLESCEKLEMTTYGYGTEIGRKIK